MVVAATLEVALLVMRGKLWCLIELPEISNTVTRFKTCKKCLKWPLNGTFHLKVTYFSTPGVFTNHFFSVHELSQAKINVQECSNSFLKKSVNRLRHNCEIRNACFAHAYFWLFFPSAYAAAAAAAHSAHGRIVVHLFHQWLCFTEQVCRFLKKSRSHRKIFSLIHYTKVFHSRTRSIQGAPTYRISLEWLQLFLAYPTDLPKPSKSKSF